MTRTRELELSTANMAVTRFGPFVLVPGERTLLEDGCPVRLGSRAFEILLLLVEHAGQSVSKEQIFQRVWPTTVVVEGNLRVHLAGLRKALGDGRGGRRFIINLPTQGYCFVAPIVRETVHEFTANSARLNNSNGMPTNLNRVIGQEATIRLITEQIRLHRLVSLVGAGGIGKTTVALAVAATVAEDRTDLGWSAVHFVDLAPVYDSQSVSRALSTALGLPTHVGETIPSLLAAVQDKALFLILDNCEHLIEAVARVAEEILRWAPRIHILATSREPLRAEGEWIQRIQPLTLPSSVENLTAREAVRFPAVELFTERASAMASTFVFKDSDVRDTVDICKRLDGIPLAIELAAARVDPLGVKGVAAALDDCFSLLSKGRRTALPRHQTLRATLDWSFSLLSPKEQSVLAGLSVFAAEFTLESAIAILASDELSPSAVLNGVTELVSKSLLNADVGGEEVLFRLLDTTRAYARDRLAQMPEESFRSRRRHAQNCLELLEEARSNWNTRATENWIARNGRRIADVHAALTWAFSSSGDHALAAAIATRATPFLFELSLTEEHRQSATQAMQVLSSLHQIKGQSEGGVA
jgi:predicted ATPase/DNA-binding winged helix-turn-helix (wHTH) protein